MEGHKEIELTIPSIPKGETAPAYRNTGRTDMSDHNLPHCNPKPSPGLGLFSTLLSEGYHYALLPDSFPLLLHDPTLLNWLSCKKHQALY